MLALPGYGDTSAIFTRRLRLIDPDERWTVAVAEPVAEGPAGPMWYTVDADGPDLDGVSRAVASIDLALDEVTVRTGVTRGDIVLVGYSQGGAAALATALDPTIGPAPRAVGLLAGYLAHRDDEHLDLSRVAGRPALFAHGIDDDMVDPIRGRGAAKALHRAGAVVSWREVASSHRLGPSLLAPLREWLAALVSGDVPQHPPPGV